MAERGWLLQNTQSLYEHHLSFFSRSQPLQQQLEFCGIVIVQIGVSDESGVPVSLEDGLQFGNQDLSPGFSSCA